MMSDTSDSSLVAVTHNYPAIKVYVLFFIYCKYFYIYTYSMLILVIFTLQCMCDFRLMFATYYIYKKEFRQGQYVVMLLCAVFHVLFQPASAGCYLPVQVKWTYYPAPAQHERNNSCSRNCFSHASYRKLHTGLPLVCPLSTEETCFPDFTEKRQQQTCFYSNAL